MEVVGADGHTIKPSVSFHKAGGYKLDHATLLLRKIEKGSGKSLADLQMAMDDPNSQTESKGVAWGVGGEFDIALKMMEQHLIRGHGRFMAEVDRTLGSAPLLYAASQVAGLLSLHGDRAGWSLCSPV